MDEEVKIQLVDELADAIEDVLNERQLVISDVPPPIQQRVIEELRAREAVAS